MAEMLPQVQRMRVLSAGAAAALPETEISVQRARQPRMGVEDALPVFDDDLYENIWGSAPSPAQFCDKGVFNDQTFKLEGCEREKIQAWMYYDELVVSGYYPTDPPVGFRYMFRYVHPNYELYRISFEDPGIQGLTEHQCLRWLLLNASNKDLSQCYDIELENQELNPWK